MPLLSLASGEPLIEGVIPNDCSDHHQQDGSGCQSLQSCRDGSRRWPWCEGSAHSPRVMRPRASSGNAKVNTCLSRSDQWEGPGSMQTLRFLCNGRYLARLTLPVPLGSLQGESRALQTRHDTRTGHSAPHAVGHHLPPSRPCWLLRPCPTCRLAGHRVHHCHGGQDSDQEPLAADPESVLEQHSFPYTLAHVRLSVSENS